MLKYACYHLIVVLKNPVRKEGQKLNYVMESTLRLGVINCVFQVSQPCFRYRKCEVLEKLLYFSEF